MTGFIRTLQYDYTDGRLPEIVDTMIEGRPKLFVCAVGIPPGWLVDKLHKAGILIMNVRTPLAARDVLS